MEREKAPFGVYHRPRPQPRDGIHAVSVGVWENELTGRNHPRLRILTLAELFRGKRPDIPRVDQPGAKSARCEQDRQACFAAVTEMEGHPGLYIRVVLIPLFGSDSPSWQDWSVQIARTYGMSPRAIAWSATSLPRGSKPPQVTGSRTARSPAQSDACRATPATQGNRREHSTSRQSLDGPPYLFGPSPLSPWFFGFGVLACCFTSWRSDFV